jgi:hypothetical protein
MDGRSISVPLAWYPRLLNASPKQRKNWQISGGGYAIHWPDIDEDLSSEGLLRGAPAPYARRVLNAQPEKRTNKHNKHIPEAKNSDPIPRQAVASEAIASIGYNRETGTLDLEFRDSGEVFRYLEVPEYEYQNFLTAESMGTYLNRDFKKAGYRYLKIK